MAPRPPADYLPLSAIPSHPSSSQKPASTPRSGLLSGRTPKVLLVVGAALTIYLSLASFFEAPTHLVSSLRPEPIWSKPSTVVVEEHPIVGLMARARERWAEKVGRQSRTLEEAVKVYQERYKREPPKGFEQWHAATVAANFVLIDEFDAISEDLEPFWQLSPKEIRARVAEVVKLPSITLLTVRSGKLNFDVAEGDQEKGWRARGLSWMLEKYANALPDLDFPVNELAECRVLVPWDKAHRANQDVHDSIIYPFYPGWRDDGSVWQSFIHTCSPESHARIFSEEAEPEELDPLADEIGIDDDRRRSVHHHKHKQHHNTNLTFPVTIDNEFDFCENPDAHFALGHMFSDWRSIRSLYPIMSPGQASGFHDIRIPSHYYFNPSSRYTYGYVSDTDEPLETDPMEGEWDEKINKLYWRGSTTGGGSSPYISQYHRHRFVRMADSPSTNLVDLYTPSPTGDGDADTPPEYHAESVVQANLNAATLDVSFTSAVGCEAYEPDGCDGMRRDYPFEEAAPFGKAWSYKFLMDLDGQGYSARFFGLQSSKSAVIKSTVYSEFFSDWIEPWLHYIPTSFDYASLYPTLAFFGAVPPKDELEATTPDELLLSQPTGTFDVYGDARAKEIALAGREWRANHVRKADMELYVYRLALEWARLTSDVRDSGAMSYTG